MTARAMLLGLLTAAATATIASPAAAYTYTVQNYSTVVVRSVWMHTVSNFCHDRNWTGALQPGQSMRMSTASTKAGSPPYRMPSADQPRRSPNI